MSDVSGLDLTALLNSFYRRKAIIIAICLVVSLLGVYLAQILPNVYRSSTLIVVTPQRVPSSFVTSTVTMDATERMQSIVQEILSRTQLENIVQEFDLYSSATKESIEDRIERLHKAVKIEFRQNNVFQLSFEAASPEKAKQVTGRLASLFIKQNLEVRERQAMGTKSFISSETDRLRKELEEQEAVVNRYKAVNRYELPDQLDMNLRNLDQLRRELQSTEQRLSALRERKAILQKQSVESDILGNDILGVSLMGSSGAATQNVQLEIKKKELDSLLQKYSGKHPDVLRLKKEIQVLDNETNSAIQSNAANSTLARDANPLTQVLQTQIVDIDTEMQGLRSQQEHIRGQIGIFQTRVDDTPARAIELSKISRGYEITLRKYQDLLGKSLESELAENMEKKQKGEQFQILDSANFPLRPVRPNRPIIILIGFLLGLGGGFGLAFLGDNFDTSFKSVDDIVAYVNVPVLASLPALMTRGTVIEQRRSQGVLVLASLGALAIGIVCLRIFAPIYF